MILYEYFRIHPKCKKEFSRKLGISRAALYKYINQERIPVLTIAIRIHILTAGLVRYRDLLPSSETIEIIEEDEDLL